jgi:hypothetical protein
MKKMRDTSEQKLSYSKPVLTSYGDVRTITLDATNFNPETNPFEEDTGSRRSEERGGRDRS